ncbi:MAG: hypothetical protein IJ877_00305 [Candidatus Gastranaerophilales bacterium]|nr:hypothetical protein [Candidatus Gastranaerophilales bacterium]
MITPVTFTSDYKVKTKGHNVEYQKKFRKFQEFANGVTRHVEGSSTVLSGGLEKKYPYFFKGSIVLSVPEELDEMVENYCNYHKIEYKKSANKNP